MIPDAYSTGYVSSLMMPEFGISDRISVYQPTRRRYDDEFYAFFAEKRHERAIEKQHEKTVNTLLVIGFIVLTVLLFI